MNTLWKIVLSFGACCLLCDALMSAPLFLRVTVFVSECSVHAQGIHLLTARRKPGISQVCSSNTGCRQNGSDNLVLEGRRGRGSSGTGRDGQDFALLTSSFMQLSRLRDMRASPFLPQGPKNLNNFDTAWQDRGVEPGSLFREKNSGILKGNAYTLLFLFRSKSNKYWELLEEEKERDLGYIESSVCVCVCV